MNNRVALYGSRRQEPYLKELCALFSFLRDSGFRVTVHSKLGKYLQERGVDMCGAEVMSRLPDDTALVLSVGGDGTFMRAARWVGDSEIPILGVNTGHLGYLASCSLEEAREMIGAICRGEVIVERRMMLKVDCEAFPYDVWPYALNEVAILKEESASMIKIRSNIDGRFLADYRADGLIVSTPTGSTAYNLSAGGPIIEPTLDCMAISPVAPHTLTVRPLVVGGDSSLELSVESRTREFKVSLDGCGVSVPTGTEVTISRADFSTLLVRPKDTNFATILRDKLLWNASSSDVR